MTDKNLITVRFLQDYFSEFVLRLAGKINHKTLKNSQSIHG